MWVKGYFLKIKIFFILKKIKIKEYSEEHENNIYNNPIKLELFNNYRDERVIFCYRKESTSNSEKLKIFCQIINEEKKLFSNEIILNFEKDYPDLKVFKLEQNYRSTQNIVEVANSVIANNKNQLQKTVFSEKEQGEKIKELVDEIAKEKKAIEEALESARKAAEREEDNTVMAKFIRNLESRIYSTLAKDISESLFDYNNPGTLENPVSGEIWLEGNRLIWINNGVTITLIVEEWFDGVLISTTEITIPIAGFGGCWSDCG
mgnify:CR=1 FL=1